MLRGTVTLDGLTHRVLVDNLADHGAELHGEQAIFSETSNKRGTCTVDLPNAKIMFECEIRWVARDGIHAGAMVLSIDPASRRALHDYVSGIF